MAADGAPDLAGRDELHRVMVDGIVAQRATLGAAVSAEVEAALRAVDRRLFVPEVSVREAYTDDAVVTKRDADGLAISSVSQPTVIAVMLEQLRVRPGDRVLEIGSGGYNAALLRELTGADGLVVTVDIDADVVDRARTTLAAAGYADVRVLHGDGELGAEGCAPYDRIIVTVGAADIPPAWVGQLAAGGRLVVPLRLRGLTRSLALERDGDHLVSRAQEMCGFVPMQGAGRRRQRQVLLHGQAGQEVALRVDDPAARFDDRLRGALATARHEVWTRVTVGSTEPFDDQDLWLACSLPRFCLLTATTEAVGRGLVDPTWRLGTPAVADGASFAYRSLRRVDATPDLHEFGVLSHGPQAPDLAAGMAEQIQVWDREHRRGAGPVVEVYPAGTPDDRLGGGLVVDRDHTRVSVRWH